MVKHIIPKRTSKSTTLEQFRLSRRSRRIKKDEKKLPSGDPLARKKLMKFQKPSQVLRNMDINLMQKI